MNYMDYTELKKLESESEYAYIFRVCSKKNTIGTWQDVADILNKELGHKYTESKYRKCFQAFESMLNENQEKIATTNGYLAELDDRRRALENERKKLQTEKLEYNKWVREKARDELICEKLSEAINDLPKFELPAEIHPLISAKKMGILNFSDCHYNAEYEIKGLMGEIINSYSPEVFEKRMWELLSATISIVNKENLEMIYVFNLGDDTDGLLRVKQLMTLRYGLLEATVKFSHFICLWLNELSKYVRVEYQSVGGNHDQLRLLNEKKDSFKDENLSMITAEFIKTELKCNPNFTFVQNPTKNIFANICGYNVLGIHGEVKNMSSAMSAYSNKYNTQIDILIGGHKHHYHGETVGLNRDVVVVPSIVGIDDFSMTIGKTSNAGALFLLIEEGKGIVQQHYIKFTR